jgi:hypothetical protein
MYLKQFLNISLNFFRILIALFFAKKFRNLIFFYPYCPFLNIDVLKD